MVDHGQGRQGLQASRGSTSTSVHRRLAAARSTARQLQQTRHESADHATRTASAGVRRCHPRRTPLRADVPDAGQRLPPRRWIRVRADVRSRRAMGPERHRGGRLRTYNAGKDLRTDPSGDLPRPVAPRRRARGTPDAEARRGERLHVDEPLDSKLITLSGPVPRQRGIRSSGNRSNRRPCPSGGDDGRVTPNALVLASRC